MQIRTAIPTYLFEIADCESLRPRPDLASRDPPLMVFDHDDFLQEQDSEMVR